jgi:hypothetical protein
MSRRELSHVKPGVWLAFERIGEEFVEESMLVFEQDPADNELQLEGDWFVVRVDECWRGTSAVDWTPHK